MYHYSYAYLFSEADDVIFHYDEDMILTIQWKIGLSQINYYLN